MIAAERLWAVLNPTLLVPALLTIGIALLWTRWNRYGRALSTATLVFVLAIDAINLDGVLGTTLENRFVAPNPLPERVDGIIVLGGSIQTSISRSRGIPVLNRNGDRLVQFAALARQYPEARLIFTGGGATDQLDEWEWSQWVMADLGVEFSRLTTEDRSTSTYQNATLSYELAKPQPGEVWLLITSAFHMPRAVGCFRVVGWDVLPYPVAYSTGGPLTPLHLPLHPFGALATLSAMGREWLSLAVYYYLGRTDALVPAPQQAGARA